MQVQLSFGREGLTVELPVGFQYRILERPPAPELPHPVAAIADALERPTAGPSLSDIAKGKRSAAISVCDITRPAPNPIVLPPLLRVLERAGIARENISILIATGLHRPATEAEMRQIVGEEVAADFPVRNHYARRQEEHRFLGNTRSGTAVFVDERFISADLHLTLGFIEPHLMLGFSGGRKLVAPGLAAEATIKELHSPRFNRHPRVREGSIEGNPLHAELLEIAAMARHDFMVDVALTKDRKIAAVFAGEPVGAHREGVEWLRSRQLQDIGTPADAVITTSAGYPLDLTFYQTVKGITAAAQVVRPGGKILMYGACAEGPGAVEFCEMMLRYRSHEEFLHAIEGTEVTIDQWQLEKLALAARKAEISYCVPGLPSPYFEALWGRGYRDPAVALRGFLAEVPQGSRVAVIPEGPYVLASARELVQA